MFLSVLIVSTLIILAFINKEKWFSMKYVKSIQKTVNEPKVLPGPKGFPLVGNLYQLGEKPQETLSYWHKAFGDVYFLKLGIWPCIVLNGYKAVHEALVKNKDAFSDRPPFKAFKSYAGGHSLSFQRFNTAYLRHRRHTSRALSGIVHDGARFSLHGIVCREVQHLFNSIDNLDGDAIDPKELLTLAFAGIIYSVCFGENEIIHKDEEYLNLLLSTNPTTDLFAFGNHVDLFPIIGYFTRYGHQRKYLSRTERFIERNKIKIAHCMQKHNLEKPGCIASILLGHGMDTEAPEGSLTCSQILSTTIEFLSAGVETSTATLLWALLHMSQYPEIQEKVSKELQTLPIDITNNLRFVDNTIRLEIPFTEACIWETMRMNTIVPFSLPHYTTTETSIAGYHIDRNMLVIINLYSVCHDAETWPNPYNFQPDRFLTYCPEDMSRLQIDGGKVAKVLAFSEGRRRCVGEKLGKVQVISVFASLLARYQVVAVDCKDKVTMYGDVSKPGQYLIKFIRR